MKKAAVAAALALTLSVPAITRADIVINAIETGGDVVFSYSGSIDLAGLGPISLVPRCLAPSSIQYRE